MLSSHPVRPHRFVSAARVAASQLRYNRRRSVLAVLSVAFAVLLVTLLLGVGYGATTRATTSLDATNREVWVSSELGLAPGRVGGVTANIEDAHELTAALESRAGVRSAQAIAFQSVYVGRDTSDLETVVGVGITGTSAPLPVREGPGFERPDVHYADGAYDGPMTHEVIVGAGTARRLDLSVGETIHVGGTVATAREHEFRVVGVSSTFSQMLGAPTVIVHLSELQTVTGTTRTDPASLVAVSTAEGARPERVAAELDAAYPDHDVRTNREQVRTVFRRQSRVLAAAAALGAVAVVAGAFLVLNTLVTVTYHQRREFAALKASGLSERFLVSVAAWQAVGLGLCGAVLGVAATPVGATLLNGLLSNLVGYSGLVVTPWWALGSGFGVALCTVVPGVALTGWYLYRLDPVPRLR